MSRIAAKALPMLILLGGLSGCSGRQRVEIVEGVSLEIAQSRVNNISNLRYDLLFAIPRAKAAQIPAKVVLRFDLKDAGHPLIVDFNGKQKNVVAIRSNDHPSAYEFSRGHIVIPATELRQDSNSIAIEFIAGDNSLNRNDNYLYTLFVPDRASTAFPCFDQPNLKAKFKLTLEIPEHWVAVANGGLLQKNLSDGRATYRFAQTKPISTYLFSFVAGEFQQIIDARNGREMTLFHRETEKEKVGRNTEAIFDLQHAALSWLEEYTGIPYPFEKFDFVLIPAFQYGGMEHPGAILYRAASLFLEESATQNQKLGRASLIAHETAHMWFGDLVTMDWFNDVWMKEVFANFMAAKIVNPSFPDVDHALRFLLRHYPSAYEVDRTEGANPIRQKLDNLKEAGTLYGAIIYQKAPIVMRHLERLIGEGAFQEGLRRYLQNFSYRNATWPDLIDILDEKSPEDLQAWSQVWVEEPGRPHIKAEVSLNADRSISSLVVEQSDPQNRSRVWNQTMEVVLAEGKKLQRFPVQLNNTTLSLAAATGLSAPDFVLANGSGYGYGNFELDARSREFFLHRMPQVEDELVRGVAWISLWEEMLDGRLIPSDFINAALTSLEIESNGQIIQSLLGYLETAFWKFQSESGRRQMAPRLEGILWRLLQNPPDKRVQASYLRTLRSIATTDAAVARLEKIWRKELTIPGLSIQENDMTTLAFELALRQVSISEKILGEQLARIKNPDRKARFQFVLPAISADQATRDNFFDKLKNEKNRTHEPWVLTALHYLHHPIRAKVSVKYLRPGLELLEEIQTTGDIFFPKRWLDAIFSGHNSKMAAETVVEFLNKRPNYPPRLKAKILQSADLLFRAARTVSDWQTDKETDS